jgi:hypothetical protein
VQTYALTATGLAAEISHFATSPHEVFGVLTARLHVAGRCTDALAQERNLLNDRDVAVYSSVSSRRSRAERTLTALQAAHNLLRPETVESLMYLYRITGAWPVGQYGWP